MFRDDRMTTATIKGVFAEEIEALGGKVSDVFDDGRHLFLRSILPEVREVRAKDQVQGGVALRTSGPDVAVHPYVFRQVCSNGAIIAHAIQTRTVAGIDIRDPDEVEPELREAIQTCGAAEAFSVAAEQMRSAQERPADLALSMMPFLSRFPGSVSDWIIRRFFSDDDKSVFGLMNSITATARDTSDPEVRWNLEELGGGLLIARPSRSPRLSGGARRRRETVAACASAGWD